MSPIPPTDGHRGLLQTPNPVLEVPLPDPPGQSVENVKNTSLVSPSASADKNPIPSKEELSKHAPEPITEAPLPSVALTEVVDSSGPLGDRSPLYGHDLLPEELDHAKVGTEPN